MTLRLAEALLWSVVGFVAGFCFCWILSRETRVDPARLSWRTRFLRLDVIRTAIGVLILLMVVVSGVRYYRVTECQTDYNAQIAFSLSERSEATGKETTARIENSEAQREFLLSLGANAADNAVSTKRYLDALDAQILALRALEESRRKNPVPRPPDCGSLR